MSYSGYVRYLKNIQIEYKGHHEYQLQTCLGSIQHIFDRGVRNMLLCFYSFVLDLFVYMFPCRFIYIPLSYAFHTL